MNIQDKIKEELQKYNIELADSGMFEKRFYFQDDLPGYKGYLRVTCGIFFGKQFSVILSVDGDSGSTIVTPLNTDLEAIENIEQFCQGVVNVFEECCSRAQNMTREFNL